MNDHADTLREIRVMENWLELRLARAHSVIIGTKDHAVHEALSEVKVRFDAIRDAAIAALEFAIKAVEDAGWRPIESAPRDELALFLIQWSEVPVVGQWDGRTFSADSEHHEVSCGAYCYGGMVGTASQTTPTHWRPLPAPPQDAAMAGKGEGT